MDMPKVATTKMSSKGQVVIPEEIRDYLGLEPGVKFLIMTSADDTIIFKKIMPIDPEHIKKLLQQSRAMAKKYNLKEEDVPKMIKESRAVQKRQRKETTNKRSK